MLCICISTSGFTKQLDGNTSLNKGEYVENSTTAPGYYCLFHSWKACVIYADVSGIDVNILDDLLNFGKLRLVFTEPWGNGQCEFTYDTPLPASIGAQIGMPTAKVATGIYTLTVTAAYPNGYIDVDVIP